MMHADEDGGGHLVSLKGPGLHCAPANGTSDTGIQPSAFCRHEYSHSMSLGGSSVMLARSSRRHLFLPRLYFVL